MSVYHRSTAKSRILQEYREREDEIAAAFSREMNSKAGLESDKKIRREIANSNERRRMQSINSGFQVLRAMIPHSEGEKLSKAAILQQTTEYISNLQQEKAKILAQNAYFKRVLGEVSRRCNVDLDVEISRYGSPPVKRKKRDTESSDEGISADFEECKYDDVKRELLELRQKLDRERQLRVILENRSRALESHHYAEKVHNVSSHVEHQPLPVKYEQKPIEELKRDEFTTFVPLQIDTEHDHRVPSSPQHKSENMDVNPSYVSRRNLETIVEAIRHLEGGEMTDEHKHSEVSQPEMCVRHATNSIHMCNDHKKDYIHSDQEEEKSECSGRDSPSSGYVKLQNAQNYQHIGSVSPPASRSLSTKVVVTNSSYTEKYPAVTHVLQGNAPPQPQFFYRPGVIVQKS